MRLSALCACCLLPLETFLVLISTRGPQHGRKDPSGLLSLVGRKSIHSMQGSALLVNDFAVPYWIAFRFSVSPNHGLTSDCPPPLPQCRIHIRNPRQSANEIDPEDINCKVFLSTLHATYVSTALLATGVHYSSAMSRHQNVGLS
jgi:hypothetical protein